MDRPDTHAPEPPPLDRVPTREIRTAAPLAIGDVGVYIARRLTALVVDIFGAGFLVALGVFATLTTLHDRISDFAWTLDAVIWPAIGASVLAYFIICEAAVGATLGKALVGLGVARADGRRLGFVRALVRNVFKPIDLCGIGFVMATVTLRRQRLGDFAAGTVVSNARIGRLAPIVAVVVAAAVSWAAFGWADGANASQQLVRLARSDAAHAMFENR